MSVEGIKHSMRIRWAPRRAAVATPVASGLPLLAGLGLFVVGPARRRHLPVE